MRFSHEPNFWQGLFYPGNRKRAFAVVFLTALSLTACKTIEESLISVEGKSKEFAANLETSLKSIASSPSQIIRALTPARSQFIQAISQKEYQRADEILGSDQEFFKAQDPELEGPIAELAAHVIADSKLRSVKEAISSIDVNVQENWTKYVPLKSQLSDARTKVISKNVYSLFPEKFGDLDDAVRVESTIDQKFRDARVSNFDDFGISNQRQFIDLYPGFESENEKRKFFKDHLTRKKISADLSEFGPSTWRVVWERLSKKNLLKSDDTEFIWQEIIARSVAANKETPPSHKSLRELVELHHEANRVATVRNADIELNELIGRLPDASVYEWIDLYAVLTKSGQLADGQRLVFEKLNGEIIPKAIAAAISNDEFDRLMAAISEVQGNELRSTVSPKLVSTLFSKQSFKKKHRLILSSWKYLEPTLRSNLMKDYTNSFRQVKPEVTDVGTLKSIAANIKELPFSLNLDEFVNKQKLETDLLSGSFVNLGDFLRVDVAYRVLPAEKLKQIITRKLTAKIDREFSSNSTCIKSIEAVYEAIKPTINGPVDVESILRHRLAIFLVKPEQAEFEVDLLAGDWEVREVSTIDLDTISKFSGVCVVKIEKIRLDTNILSEEFARSEMIIGQRSIPNPVYRQAEMEYQTNLANLQQAEMRKHNTNNSVIAAFRNKIILRFSV